MGKSLPSLLLALALLLPSPETARGDGFSVRAGGGILVLDRADNLSARGYAVANRDEKPRGASRIFPIPVVELRYAWDGNRVSFGSAADEPAGFGLSYHRKLDKGGMSGSAFFSAFGREWQNPYLFGTPRTETKVRSYGGRVAFEEIGGTPVTLAVKGVIKKVEDEALTGDLRRDGALLDVDLSWRQRFGQWTVTPLMGYQRGEYEGAANSFHGGTLGLMAGWRNGDLLISTRIAGSVAQYDQVHPVFGRKRHETGYRFSTLCSRDNPFGWQNGFTAAGIALSRTDGNMDFFATKTLLGHVTVGYRF